MLSLAPNMLPDTWQVPKYFKWMPVMTEFTFSLHLSWVLVPLPLGYQISTSNPVNPNHKLSEFWAPPLAFALLCSSSPSFPCSLPFFSCHWQSNWSCSVPHYLYQSVIRFSPFCLFSFWGSLLSSIFHSCSVSGFLSLSTLSVTEPSHSFKFFKF